MKKATLEFWADSFHEGVWACEQLANFFKVISIDYSKGFIPVFQFQASKHLILEVAVFGSYKNWKPIPEQITSLLDWGKPDLVIYNPDKKQIILAIEETAAVPTGNQALQRCERMYGSLRSQIPFWYLLGEFGVHHDGGVRRDSIWPTVLGLKLSCMHRTPCVVLHYSDQAHPEDYSIGEGVNSLFRAVSTMISIELGLVARSELKEVLGGQYNHMIDFVKSQAGNIVNFIPNQEKLYDKNTPELIANLVSTQKPLDNSLLDFFNWKKTEELPEDKYNEIVPGGVIKEDKLVDELESLVEQKLAYTLSRNAGSRPQEEKKVKEWIHQQKQLFRNNLVQDLSFDLRLGKFPKSDAGRRHVTTAKNVFYLIDDWSLVVEAIKKAYPRLKKLDGVRQKPAFVYISNSIKPGRIFGDPFTGQLSAYTNIFAKDVAGSSTRISIAYYPHQVHTQLFNEKGEFRKNKGIITMRELLDYALFQGGALVELKSGKIL